MIDVPAKQIPSFRYKIAMDQKIKQIMMTTWGGLGDQVCAEPSLRYAFKLFKEYEISLLTSFPEMFTHLPFKNIFSKKDASSLNEDEWLVIHTNHPNNNMTRDFVTHHFTQCVDFSSLCAFQRQLPIIDRQIILPSWEINLKIDPKIVIHPGRHWKSKSFPKQWWDEVIKKISETYSGVIIVGKDIDQETGTIDVDIPSNCVDLRNKLSLPELTMLLKIAQIVITNDSAPLHIAASGNAHIVFIATCKEPDYLFHWRHSEFGWRMYNLGLDGLWNHQDSCPIREEGLNIDYMSQELLNRCLPGPKNVLNFVTKLLIKDK